MTHQQPLAEKGKESRKQAQRRLPMSRQELGQRGEEIAVEYLCARGYKIIDRNARFTVGEADIIASLGSLLVLVEVKTRKNSGFGLAEAVSPRKMARMRRAAGAWLASDSGSSWESVRFDVITVLIESGGSPEITHYEAVDRGAC